MKYIEEYLVTIIGLLTARYHWSDMDPKAAIKQLAKDYDSPYDDHDVKAMFEESFEQVVRMMPSIVKGIGGNSSNFGVLADTCHTLQTAIESFDISGKKRRKLFSGAFFSRSKNPIRSVATSVKSQVETYSLLIISGKIPVSEIERIQSSQ